MGTRSDPEPKETLTQKRAQLQNYEMLQRDILAHEGAVKSVANAAAAVVAAVGDPQISQQLYNIKHDYKTAKEAVQVTWHHQSFTRSLTSIHTHSRRHQKQQQKETLVNNKHIHFFFYLERIL